MKIFENIEQNTPEWDEIRRAKITGSKGNGLYSPPTKSQMCGKLLNAGLEDEAVMEFVGCAKATVTKARKQLLEKGIDSFADKEKKIVFYELLAERIGVPRDEEKPMERGSRLEDEAIEELEKEFGKIERVGFCVRDDNENIAISMDGRQGKNKRAFEVKCLSSAKHLKALLEQQIPSEYECQKLQYFVVDEELEELVFAFYDPRIPAKPLHYIIVKRKDIEGDIQSFLDYQIEVLKELDTIAEQIAF